MPHHQAFRQTADRRTAGIVQALNGEQHLVLLRFQPFRGRRFLAEPEKATDLIPEIAEGPVVGLGKAVRGSHASTHYYIVSRYFRGRKEMAEKKGFIALRRPRRPTSRLGG